MDDQEISHRDLMDALVSGSDITRQPVAFWRHFPADDQDPERLAEATAMFQGIYDLDLIKVSPSSSFCIRDWGIEDSWNGNTEGTRDYLNYLSLDEAKKIYVLEPTIGSLGKQLKALEIITNQFLRETPVIETIFSPLSQLKNLLGKKNLANAIRQEPEKVKTILDVITETTSQFMQSCLTLQIDGFFYAVQHASADVLSREEFQVFGKAYDERLFELLGQTDFSILHVHGSHIYFDTMLDYPCSIINWHDRDTDPNLSAAARKTKKILCGGLSRIQSMVTGDEKMITEEIMDAAKQIGSKNFLLGTGCVLPIIAPHGNIQHAITTARSL
jgi:uroporphyrinogen decarboxylase